MPWRTLFKERTQDHPLANEEQLRLLIDATPAAIAMLDRDMCYVAYSHRYVSDYGLDEGPLIGRCLHEVFPDIPERWKQAHRRCLAGAVERNDNDLYLRANGTSDSVRWEARPWHRPSGAIGGIMLFSEIITERKRAEQALAAAQRQLRLPQTMEALGQLTGGVAHDFNNLLGVIILATEDLANTMIGNPLQIELTAEIMKSALSGAELIRRLLAFGRRQTLQPAAICLNEHLTDFMPMVQRTLGEAIHITCCFATDLWPTYADPSQVRNALLNLVINARDAMPAGGRLEIETVNAHFTEDEAARMAEVLPGDYVVLSVTDTGCGMAPDVILRAVEPFFTTKAIGVGTGLGLSMIYGFAKQSRGHVKIYSEVGCGTTVRLYLPRSLDHGKVGENAIQDCVAIPRGSESILLVEDKVELSSIAMRQLVSLGYDVRAAESGPAALEILNSGAHFDLLFTDVVMPGGMSGYQLAETARQLRPDIAVLFTTGYAHELNHGSVDVAPSLVLSKPYDRRQLAESIRAALTRS